jgi:uncharacterized protein (DUF924 family)
MSFFDDILQLWFNGVSDESTILKNKPPASLWFNGGRRFDEEIRAKFLADYEKAKAGEYKDWEASARGRLALVIIFDQFSRNMFRGMPQAFATDGRAIELAQRSIKDGKDKELMLVERVFLYMTFMHAESLAVQEQGVTAFEALVEESRAKTPQNTPYFEYNLKYARQHRDIIARFGRFPHRNSVLKRPPTPEEEAFLKSPGSSF